jgi:hypothetical protein
MKLSVRANFLRRGGIEINPVRSTPGYNLVFLEKLGSNFNTILIASSLNNFIN